MRKILFYIFLAALIITGCKNTNTHNRVKNSVETLPDYKGWVIGSFVNQFGEETGNHFLKNNYHGNISTMTLGKIDMTVRCIIDSSAFQMEFYEYGKYLIRNYGYSELNIKDSNGKIHEFRQFGSDGIRITKEKRDSIINIISHNGTIKMSVRIQENEQGRGGSFSIQGTQYLKDLMTEANIK